MSKYRPMYRLRPGVLVALLLSLVTLTGVSVRTPAVAAMPAGCTAVAATVLDCDVPVPAAVGSVGAVDTRVRVALPDATFTGPRPVLYLLHGVGDTYRTIVDNTGIEQFVAGLGAIVVMPDGGRTPNAGWYSDWADGSRRYETFHTRVLVPWVDANFATLADRSHRGVAGVSMGGFGALSYAARYADLFGAAGATSGFLDSQFGGPATGYGQNMASSTLGTPRPEVWGDPALAADEWAAHNPTVLARAGALDHLAGNIWLAGGTGTPGGPAGEPASPTAYGVEHYIWQTNQQFRLAALGRGLAFHDEAYLGGGHDWPHYEYGLRRILPGLVAAIS